MLVHVIEPSHEITKGLPPTWMHASDGPHFWLTGTLENMTILSYARDDSTGTGFYGQHR